MKKLIKLVLTEGIFKWFLVWFLPSSWILFLLQKTNTVTLNGLIFILISLAYMLSFNPLDLDIYEEELDLNKDEQQIIFILLVVFGSPALLTWALYIIYIS